MKHSVAIIALSGYLALIDILESHSFTDTHFLYAIGVMLLGIVDAITDLNKE